MLRRCCDVSKRNIPSILNPDSLTLLFQSRSYADSSDERSERPKVNRFAAKYSKSPKPTPASGPRFNERSNGQYRQSADWSGQNDQNRPRNHQTGAQFRPNQTSPPSGPRDSNYSNSSQSRWNNGNTNDRSYNPPPVRNQQRTPPSPLQQTQQAGRPQPAYTEKPKPPAPAPILTPLPLRMNVPKRAKKLEKKMVKIYLPPYITVANLASAMNVRLNDVFKKLTLLGYEDVRHDYILDKENAAMIADEYGIEVITSEGSSSEDIFSVPIKEELLKERPPVVTIMGHVDHGKTTILDHLRKSSIVDTEFGGITQHIGAFSVITPVSKKKITFLDTPGHAAFLKMRERGAIVTDIVILVVAADDSVMPQTIEAIKHAKKSGVPMIVAINKCDKHDVNIDKVLADISAQGVDIEDYGGETQTVRVSGKTGLNMDKLEEAVITLSELSEFRSEEKGVPAEGWIIESQVAKGLGNVATVLVRRGTLTVGDVIVAGNTHCKIRGMKNEHGKPVKTAGPSTPVQIWGWKELPDSGEQVLQAKSESIAKKVINYRESRQKEIQAEREVEEINVKRQEAIKETERLEQIGKLKSAGLDYSELENEGEESKKKVCNYIVKSDFFGSAEAIAESLDGLGNDEIQAKVIYHEAGAPTDSDVELAKTVGGTIICFNIKVPKQVAMKAEAAKVTIKEQNIIYRVIEEVTEELSSYLAPRIEYKYLAEAQVLQVFKFSGKAKKLVTAGSRVTSGELKRNALVKVFRGRQEVHEGKISTLKHGKDDVATIKNGSECGVTFEDWNDFQAGDVIKAYERIEHKRYL
ncbi:Translation initiation factor IF-2 mitochondrial [Spathaspora sp. JA1]|nr:Translation initiation factor IF-2 mitochondrial [Spathaspora sp. JA1]